MYLLSSYHTYLCMINVVQLLNHVRFFATPWTVACQASLSFFISQSLLKLMSIESVMPSNHLIVCHLLLLPSIFPKVLSSMINTLYYLNLIYFLSSVFRLFNPVMTNIKKTKMSSWEKENVDGTIPIWGYQYSKIKKKKLGWKKSNFDFFP